MVLAEDCYTAVGMNFLPLNIALRHSQDETPYLMCILGRGVGMRWLIRERRLLLLSLLAQV